MYKHICVYVYISVIIHECMYDHIRTCMIIYE